MEKREKDLLEPVPYDNCIALASQSYVYLLWVVGLLLCLNSVLNTTLVGAFN